MIRLLILRIQRRRLSKTDLSRLSIIAKITKLSYVERKQLRRRLTTTQEKIEMQKMTRTIMRPTKKLVEISSLIPAHIFPQGAQGITCL
jgi:hypothetical protein